MHLFVFKTHICLMNHAEFVGVEAYNLEQARKLFADPDAELVYVKQLLVTGGESKIAFQEI